MRAQPGLTTIAPADAAQAQAALRATRDHAGPIYFRVSKRGDALPGLDGRFTLGGLEVVREGSGPLLLAIGSIAHEAVAAATQLAEEGHDPAVAVISSFNPNPDEQLAQLIAAAPLVLTVEGALPHRWSGLARGRAHRGARLGTRLVRAGLAEMPAQATGSQAYMEQGPGSMPPPWRVPREAAPAPHTP